MPPATARTKTPAPPSFRRKSSPHAAAPAGSSPTSVPDCTSMARKPIVEIGSIWSPVHQCSSAMPLPSRLASASASCKLELSVLRRSMKAVKLPQSRPAAPPAGSPPSTAARGPSPSARFAAEFVPSVRCNGSKNTTGTNNKNRRRRLRRQIRLQPQRSLAAPDSNTSSARNVAEHRVDQILLPSDLQKIELLHQVDRASPAARARNNQRRNATSGVNAIQAIAPTANGTRERHESPGNGPARQESRLQRSVKAAASDPALPSQTATANQRNSTTRLRAKPGKPAPSELLGNNKVKPAAQLQRLVELRRQQQQLPEDKPTASQNSLRACPGRSSSRISAYSICRCTRSEGRKHRPTHTTAQQKICSEGGIAE